jgi:hypothetical protein
MVRRATKEFGAVQLFIHHVEGGADARDLRPRPRRCQSATLVGFLRSGRVVQNDTLLSITLDTHADHSASAAAGLGSRAAARYGR